MISINTSWGIVRNNALKAYRMSLVYDNIRERAAYHIAQVNPDNIVIHRNGGNGLEILRKGEVHVAIYKLNNSVEGSIYHLDFIDIAAKETTIVLFHPQLSWSEDRRHVIAVNL